MTTNEKVARRKLSPREFELIGWEFERALILICDCENTLRDFNLRY